LSSQYNPGVTYPCHWSTSPKEKRKFSLLRVSIFDI